MITLDRFSQGAILQSLPFSDYLTRNGICVALCDYWLAMIKDQPNESPAARLERLHRQHFAQAMNHQRQYAVVRAQHGREEGRRMVGQQVGLNYHDQTMIMRALIGIRGIREKMAADISRIGAAATWTLRFADGGGHAIAGFCGLSGQQPYMKMRLHVFDPNIGEYTGELQELDAILNDLLNKFPDYQTITDVHRTSEEGWGV